MSLLPRRPGEEPGPRAEAPRGERLGPRRGAAGGQPGPGCTAPPSQMGSDPTDSVGPGTRPAFVERHTCIRPHGATPSAHPLSPRTAEDGPTALLPLQRRLCAQRRQGTCPPRQKRGAEASPEHISAVRSGLERREHVAGAAGSATTSPYQRPGRGGAVSARTLARTVDEQVTR